MKLPVKNLDNQDVGEIDLADAVFGIELRKDILHRAVTWQLAKRRAGTHSTLNKKNVSGSRIKPFKQKGTGRARQGFKRAAQMRGGGIVGEHTVSFIAEDEIITFAHSARERSLFARGAVEAAAWVLGKPPGLYAMSDVLGFTSET